MTSDNSTLPPLPPYVYGRETGVNEKVWSESGVRDAQDMAIAFAKTPPTARNPLLSVDAVVVGLFGQELKVALVSRTDPAEPDHGKLELPGGSVHVGEDKSTTAAIQRVLKDKLGFKPSHLEQAFTESGPSRDPRGWSSSVVHLALHQADALQALADAGKFQLFTVWPRSQLPADVAFDHAAIVKRAIERLVAKASYSTIVAHFLPRVFTMTDLHKTCEIVCRRKANSANFRRKVLEYQVLDETGTLHSFGRPAQGYKLKRDIAYFDKQIL